MCGRFTLTTTPAELAAHFALDDVPDSAPRFNVAPGQDVLTIRRGQDAKRTAARCRWGLVPQWAKDPAIGSRMINARAETLAEKVAFRHAFRRRRCLVPADGFYEWAPGRPRKQPYRIARADGCVFGLAGLWERRRDPDGSVLETCSIVTTVANACTRAIHPRMPVILAPGAYDLWLDAQAEDVEALRALLQPCPASWLVARPVGLRVNDVRHDDAGCLAPPEPGARQERLL